MCKILNLDLLLGLATHTSEFGNPTFEEEDNGRSGKTHSWQVSWIRMSISSFLGLHNHKNSSSSKPSSIHLLVWQSWGLKLFYAEMPHIFRKLRRPNILNNLKFPCNMQIHKIQNLKLWKSQHLWVSPEYDNTRVDKSVSKANAVSRGEPNNI